MQRQVLATDLHWRTRNHVAGDPQNPNGAHYAAFSTRGALCSAGALELAIRGDVMAQTGE